MKGGNARRGLFRTPALPWSHPALWIATWGGSGLLRWAPGTAGSLAALPFAAALLYAAGALGMAVAALVLFAAGIWAAQHYSQAEGQTDSAAIVVDEVVGQWLALLPATLTLTDFVIGFALFRFFDVVKPWPIRWLDRHVKGGLGVMLDDVAAGVAALCCLSILQWLGFVPSR